MKAAVVYYSYTGKCTLIAKEKAQTETADLIELKDKKRPGVFQVYFFGSFKAMKQKKANLAPFLIDFTQYDRIIAVMPIWASMPAPAFNNLVEILPEGSQIEMILASAGGDSRDAAQKIKETLEAKGCTLVKTTDIKTGK